MLCVLDSSVALAWVLPGEATSATDELLGHILRESAIAPSLWITEIAAVLVIAERRKRISRMDRQTALQLLSHLPIVIEAPHRERIWTECAGLADGHGLTVYDACYLDACLRLQLPLATLDTQLMDVARACGVALLGR